MTEKVVGIIGGMGPEATIDLMRRVIALTPAEGDADHIHMLVDNNPKVPSRIQALIEKTGPSPAPFIADMARGLVAQGADFLAMPCNTAHHYYAEIAAAVSAPVLNLMQLTAAHIAVTQAGTRRLGLLASSALLQIHLYEPWFDDVGIELVYPDVARQSALMNLIRAVKAGKQQLNIAAFNEAAGMLADRGADSLLIACTELSVIAEHLRSPLVIEDAAQILAKSIVAKALSDQ
ncbi:MAG: aspartate/glutamate racemase family protein [Congregibacter sp.]